jgi:hypothetical protein
MLGNPENEIGEGRFGKGWQLGGFSRIQHIVPNIKPGSLRKSEDPELSHFCPVAHLN